jgi:hypothetical protein
MWVFYQSSLIRRFEEVIKLLDQDKEKVITVKCLYYGHSDVIFTLMQDEKIIFAAFYNNAWDGMSSYINQIKERRDMFMVYRSVNEEEYASFQKMIHDSGRYFFKKEGEENE